MRVPAGYQVLFLTGGASTQFAMVPMNLMDKAADYAVTGYWSKKAVAEAKLFGEVRTAFTSEAEKFAPLPARPARSSPPRAPATCTSPPTTRSTARSTPSSRTRARYR